MIVMCKIYVNDQQKVDHGEEPKLLGSKNDHFYMLF